MAKDYKNTRRPKDRRKKAATPVWLVFATGLASGLFVAALVFLQQEKDSRQPASGQAPPSVAASPAPQAQAAAAKQTPAKSKPAAQPAPVVNLDIPTPEKDSERLAAHQQPDKQAEVTVKKSNEAGGVEVYTFYNELEKGQELPLPETPQVEKRKGDLYVLQAGSFRRWADADRLRARLALLGVESKVQTVTMDGGDVWHRVRVGPMKSFREIDKLRRRMHNGNISSMLMTIRSGDS